VSLDAVDHEARGERAAAPVLDGVAEALHRRGLAHDAEVDRLAAALELLHHAHRAVDRGSFLVGGDEERHGTGVVRVVAHEAFGGGHERGDGGLHVGGTAPEELAFADRGLEGVRVPLLDRSRRHHVGMAREHHQRLALAVADEEVGDVAANEHLGLEAQGDQAVDDELLAALVGGGDRLASDQRFGELQRFVLQGGSFR
jgi:hypothetical protein